MKTNEFGESAVSVDSKKSSPRNMKRNSGPPGSVLNKKWTQMIVTATLSNEDEYIVTRVTFRWFQIWEGGVHASLPPSHLAVKGSGGFSII